MTDLVPMLVGDPTELEALLLQSADDDEPAVDALERVSAALGVSAGALGAVATGSALGAPAAIAGKAVALSKPLTFASLAKWLAVGIGAGMATGGVAQVASRAFEPAPHAVVAPRTVVAEPRAKTALAAARVIETAAPAAEPTPPISASPASTATFPALPAATATAEPAPTAAPAHTGSASFDAPESSPSTESSSTLSDETKTLDGARHALATGNAGAALGMLEHYRAKWPRGALRAEAALLRVDALLRLGNRPAAEREANALIHAAPTSRYATRAKALLGSSE